jgi:hypothetical protein
MGNILADSILLIKRNIIIVTPAIIVSLITLILSIILIGNDFFLNMPKDTSQEIALLKEVAWKLIAITITNFYLQVVAHAVTAVIAFGTLSGVKVTVQVAFSYTLKRGWRLFVAASVLGIMLFSGLILFMIPSIIAAFLFMFTFIIIIKEDKGPLESLKKSYTIVKKHMNSAFQIFLVVSIASMIFMLIKLGTAETPYLDAVFTSFLSGIMMSFSTLLLLKYYLIVDKPDSGTK